MPDPIARKRPTAETFDVSAFPPVNRGGSLNVYAMENAVPAAPGDVAAFPHDLGGGPNADEGVGPTTPCGSVIIHSSDSEDNASIDNTSVFARIVVNGSTGDECGLILFSGGQSDSYVELRIRIGAGTAGQIRLRMVHQGTEVDGHSAADECSVNEYDLPSATAITLKLCVTRRYRLCSTCASLPTVSGSVTVGATTYTIADYSLGYAGILNYHWRAGLCVATGSAITFDDFYFAGVTDPYPGDPVSGTGCEECSTCNLLDPDGFTWSLSDWTQAAGTWTLSGGLPRTSDANAILILDEAYANDNLWLSFGYTTGTPPYKARFLFSYVDANNHWIIEKEVLADSDYFFDSYLRIIERKDGSETTHFETNAANVWTVYVIVYDCTVWVNIPTGYYCIGDQDLNKTGQVGIGTKTLTDYVSFDGVVGAECPYIDLGECDDIIDYPDDDPPGDPTGCCSDLADLNYGDTIEVTISGITYFFLAPCAGACGDSDFITALNATHTLTCVYKTATHAAFYVDLGLIDTGDIGPCDPYLPTEDLETMKLWVWVTAVGGGECQWRGMLVPSKTSVCLMYFIGSPDVTGIPTVCDGWSLVRDTTLETSLGLDALTCCRQGGALAINIP